MKHLLIFKCLLISSIAFSQEKVYFSSFLVMGSVMDMRMEMDWDKKTATLTDPGKKNPVPMLSMVKIVQDSFFLEKNLYGLSYRGKFINGKDSIHGTMFQSEITWEANFGRKWVKTTNLSIRPQTPEGPFPYTTEEIVLNSKDGAKIYGTYTHAVNETKNCPLVIFASGTGPQDRDCDIFGHRSFAIYADYLARNGVSSFRFDDRGSGKSTEKYMESSLTDFGNDVSACVKYFKKKRKFKKHKLGLLGHSEGGMHILMAQKKFKKKVKFIVFLASVGGSGTETLIQQQYDIRMQKGDTISAVWHKQFYTEICSIIAFFPTGAENKDSIIAFCTKKYAEAPEAVKKEYKSKAVLISAQYIFAGNEWGKEFVDFSALNHLKNVHVPSLALFGEKDLQVSAKENTQYFQQAFAQNPHLLTVKTIASLNHLLQKCSLCNLDEYAKLTESVNPSVLTEIIQFIQKQ